MLVDLLHRSRVHKEHAQAECIAYFKHTEHDNSYDSNDNAPAPPPVARADRLPPVGRGPGIFARRRSRPGRLHRRAAGRRRRRRSEVSVFRSKILEFFFFLTGNRPFLRPQPFEIMF